MFNPSPKKIKHSKAYLIECFLNFFQLCCKSGKIAENASHCLMFFQSADLISFSMAAVSPSALIMPKCVS